MIWIHAPKGFRPSNWASMLCEIDEAFDLDSHIVDPAYVVVNGRHRLALQVKCSLLDDSGDEQDKRAQLFRELICRVAALGLEVTVPPGFAKAYPTWWSWLQETCHRDKIELTVEEPQSLPSQV